MQDISKEITIQDVISKKKETSRRVDSKQIMKAYNYALEHHGDQKRHSGEPYIIHPLNVAYILAEVGLDEATICAALLHDVVEDTDVTDSDLRRDFGEEIADMVAGVTKLGTMMFSTVEEQQVEDYRKMFLAMGKDIRVIIIKLADRLHNMRTLKYLKRERFSGMCSRSYYVGDNVREEDIKANFKNGILTVEFPKEPEKKVEEKKYIPIGE